MTSRRHLAAACAFMLLSACGGGDSDNNNLPGSDASDAATRAALQATLAPRVHPTTGARITVRWAPPIKVKANGDSEALAAMDAIEARLGVTVFDRTSIANTADGVIADGLIVKRGAAYCPGAVNSCGSVSANGTQPVQAGLPLGVVLYKSDIGLGGTPGDGRQLPSNLDVAIHEFGHAMGMPGHFDGFGSSNPGTSNSPAISPLFWRVLRTIYSNPPGTPLDQVVLAPQ